MSSRFQKKANNYPVVFGGARPAGMSKREKVLFAGVAGMCLSVVVGMIAVVNFQHTANAKGDNPSNSNYDVAQVELYQVGRSIRAGERVKSTDLKKIAWRRNEVPEGAIRSVAEVDGLFAKENIDTAQPLTRSLFSREPSTISLPVTPGNRAVAIEVDETGGIEGHALPGTRVDVVLTYTEGDALTTKIIVQNARILSAGGDTRSGAEMGAPKQGMMRKSARTITLDVAVKDALEIQTARQLGRLSLLMRAADDDKTAAVIETNKNDISGNKKSTAKKPACRSGRMKSGNKEYLVDCDGSMVEVIKDNDGGLGAQ